MPSFGGPSLGQAVLELVTDSTKFDNGLTAAEQQAQRFGSRLSLAIAGAGILGFGLAAKAAIDFESAFTSVRKTVVASEPEFEQFEAGLRAMAKDIPQTAASLAELTGIAGQLGIENAHLLTFTRTMADLGVATNLTSENAAIMLARFANVTNMDQTKFRNLGSSIVALGNNFATTEADIAQFVVRIAGAGEIAGMTEADLLGISAALSSVGVEAEAGGTAVQKVFLKMTESVATADEFLEVFAATAGMSADAFARLWREDPSEAFTLFVEGLGKAGQDAFIILDQLDLKDQRLIRSFLSLAGAGDLLREAVTLANTAFEQNTELTLEAERRYATTASQLVILKNTLIDVGITFGNAITPAIGAASEGLGGFINLFGMLPDGTQQLILLGLTVTTLGPKFAQMAHGAITAMTNINAATGKSRLSLLGWGAAITAALAVTDILARETTGHGLFELLFGNIAEADRIEDAAKRVLAISDAYTDQAKRVQALSRDLGDNAQAWAGIQSTLDTLAQTSEGRSRSHDHEGAVMRKNQESLEERVRQTAAALKAQGLTTEELYFEYQKLPPALQKIFDAETLVVASHTELVRGWQQGLDPIERYGAAVAKAALVSQDLQKPTIDLTAAFGGWGLVLDQLGVITKTSFETWRGEILPTISSTEMLSDFISEEFGPEIAKVFDELVETVEETFESVRDAYDSILPDVDETFTEWKKRIKDMAAEHAKFETSLVTIWNNIKVSGIALPEAMLTAIAEKGPAYANMFAKWFTEDPKAALASLTVAADLSTGETVESIIRRITNGAPGVSTAVSTLLVKPWQDNMTESDAAAATAAINMHEALITGIQDPTSVANSVAAFEYVGEQVTIGLATGMGSQAGRAKVSEAAASIIKVALDVMQVIGIIRSPSELFANQVGEPLAHGVAVGLTRGLTIYVIPAVEAGMNSLTSIIQEKGSLSVEEIRKILDDAAELVKNAPLTEAMRQTAEEALAKFDLGLRNGRGVPAKTLQNFLDGLIEDAENGLIKLRYTTDPKLEEWFKSISKKLTDGKVDTEVQLQAMVNSFETIFNNAPMSDAARGMIDDFIETLREGIEDGEGLVLKDIADFIKKLRDKVDEVKDVAAGVGDTGIGVLRVGPLLPIGGVPTGPGPTGAYGKPLVFDKGLNAWVEPGQVGSMGVVGNDVFQAPRGEGGLKIDITLEVDKKVLATAVIDPWLEDQLTTGAQTYGGN